MVSGANCLDLFAGTGALGMEAASRGAGSVVLNDTRRDALASAVALLGRCTASTDSSTRACAARVAVRHDDALALLKELASERNDDARQDLVFLDPPFGKDWLPRLLPLAQRALSPHGMLYVESEEPPEALENLAATWQIHRRGQAGQVYFYLLQQANTPEPS